MSSIEATSNVKDMLLNGASKDELMEALEKEIAAAQKEIEEAEAASKREKESNEARKRAREKMIVAVIEYLDTAGFIDKDSFNDEDIAEISNTIEEVEQDYLPLMLFTNKVKSAKRKKSTKDNISSVDKDILADDIIKEFLKSL